jgi:type IV pilus assembly protein PilW
MNQVQHKTSLWAKKYPAEGRQRGWTLIELMVALTISLLVCLAAMSSLILARKGFSTVDAASQLRDNGRFSVDLIQRLAVHSGFKDMFFAATPVSPSMASSLGQTPPNISGLDNAQIDSPDALNEARARAEGSEAYGSDILILRYQTSETYPGSGVSDQSMIDCAGHSPSTTPVDRHDRMVNILHVAIDQGEPTLMCSYSANGTAPFTTIPLVQGVENFQVLYGTNRVTAGTASLPATTAGAPDNFLRADQLIVPGNPVGTNNNWRRVRSLRIGMVLRGPPNSAQEKLAQTLYPLGKAKASTSGKTGSAMSSTKDPGTVFKAPADGRLRQVISFTVHLRNDQGL